MAKERKKLKDLTIDELKSYYELAQKRFDQAVRMCQINKSEPGYQREDQRKFNTLRLLVDALAAEIERRLFEELDLSNN